jgi:hypothetical protein
MPSSSPRHRHWTTEQANPLEHGELLGKLRVLQLNPKPLTELRSLRVPVQAEYLDVPRIPGGHALADFYSRCFPRAVGSEKAKTIAEPRLEIETSDGNHVLVGPPRIADAKGGSGRVFQYGVSRASGRVTFKT